MMKTYFLIYMITLIYVYNECNGLDTNKYTYNANLDFLKHETGSTNGQVNGGFNNQNGNNKQQSFASANNKRDYVAPVTPPPLKDSSQFPALGSNNRNNHQQSSVTANNKRDYVAPVTPPPLKDSSQFPALGSNNRNNHQQSSVTTNNKRDYVAPVTPSPLKDSSQFPAIGSHNRGRVASPNEPTNNPNLHNTQHQSMNSKRDYVANPFPALPTKQPSTTTVHHSGKVKDLINFYDRKDGQNKDNPSSYSTIVQGDDKNNNKGSGSMAETGKSTGTTKPSFSGIFSGSTKMGNSDSVTPKSTTKVPIATNNMKPTPPSKPGVMPSSLVNNNKNDRTNGPTDDEIQILSEELLKKDVNNAAKYITINYQGKALSSSPEDKAPLPLIVAQRNVWDIPTIKLFLPLLDNYERDTMINEYITPQERNEENAFMDGIMSTTVIRQLMSFLKDKGYVTPDPRQQRDFLKQMWFNLYSRGKGKISSSGFEHVFVSELNKGEVSGLHNWIYFSKEEAANRANYLGYLKYITLNEKGAVLKFHFNQLGVDKPVDSIFIGTSPELEMALYTLCFVTRADQECKIKLSGKDVNIKTHTFRYRSKNYIGSAYAQF